MAVVDGGEIDAVRILVLAGHVRGDIPAPLRTLSGHHQPPATVSEVTDRGRRLARRFARLSAS